MCYILCTHQYLIFHRQRYISDPFFETVQRIKDVTCTKFNEENLIYHLAHFQSYIIS